MIIPRIVSSARFCSFPFTRAENTVLPRDGSRTRRWRFAKSHRLDHAAFFGSATLEVTHVALHQLAAFNEIFHFVILRAFAAGKAEFEICRSLTRNADR